MQNKKTDKLLEELKPIWNSLKELTIENDYLNPIANLNKNFALHKLDEFARNIEEKTKQRREEFLKELKKDEIPFFLECIRKTMNFDDSLQIFIITELLIKNRQSNNLSYQEKALYYNINQFSEDDFAVYYCYYKRFILQFHKENGLNTLYTLECSDNTYDLNTSILKKFINLNILNDHSSVQIGAHSNIELEFSETSYSNELFNILDDYYKNKEICCNQYLGKIEEQIKF